MQVNYRNVKFSLTACPNWLLEYLLLVMGIIVVIVLLWYPQDAPWYLVINKSTSASHLLLFQLSSSHSSPFWALAPLFLLQSAFFPSKSLGLSSSAILWGHSSWFVCGCLWLCISASVGALGLCQSLSPQDIPACLGHKGNLLIDTDPGQAQALSCFLLTKLEKKPSM